MTWWVLNAAKPAATYNSLTLRAFTTTEDHLYTAWAYHKPARHPIYRTIRGTTKLCGYRYIWDTPNITEQAQPGDTIYHTFWLSNLEQHTTIWYYMYAPDGPYGLEIQGPLQHYKLPLAPWWPRILVVGTKLKGIYYTRTLKGPGEGQPTWMSVNDGLLSLKIWQLCPDLLAPTARMFCIAGDLGSRAVYRLGRTLIPWWWPLWPFLWPDWEPVLTNAQACTLTGSPSGTICWIAPNANLPGRFYVLFNSGLTENGTWCLRSPDYGTTWTAHQIYAGVQNYAAGNILAGLDRGTSPYTAGSLLYAALNVAPGGHAALYRSTDWGASWTFTDWTGTAIHTPRCTVDPTDQAIVYLTAFISPDDPHELYRSVTHGTALAEVDGALHLGFFIDMPHGQMWVCPGDNLRVRVLNQDQIWQSSNFCATWADPIPLEWPAARLAIIDHSPDYLYLGRPTSAPTPPDPVPPHVFFISDNNGLDMHGRCGDHADQPDGGGDSIPFNCGGVCFDGILHPDPWALGFFD